MKGQELAMQEICVHCGREQYKPAVYGISTEQKPFAWCGETSPAMTLFEYKEKIRLLKARGEKN
jgi:hypothetical protein